MTTADIRNALLTAAGDAADELNRLTAEVERLTALLPVEPPATPAVFGVDRGGLDLAPAGFGFFRGPYLPPGSLTKTPFVFAGNRGRVADAYAKGCRVFSVSYKDRGPVAMDNLTAFLASFPDDAEILLTYWHEHDGNLRGWSLTLADYQQGCREARQVADAVGAAFGPIHNGVTYVGGKWGVNPDQWRAIRWANEHDVEVHAIDLPVGVTLAAADDDVSLMTEAAPPDPLRELAAAAGDPDA